MWRQNKRSRNCRRKNKINKCCGIRFKSSNHKKTWIRCRLSLRPFEKNKKDIISSKALQNFQGANGWYRDSRAEKRKSYIKYD